MLAVNASDWEYAGTLPCHIMFGISDQKIHILSFIREFVRIMQVTTVGSLTLVGNQWPELIKRVMGNLEEGRIAFVQGILKRG